MTCPVLSLTVLFLEVLVTVGDTTEWGDLRLPEEHLPYFFRNNADIKHRCRQDEQCPYKAHLDTPHCWGYEDSCSSVDRMSMPYCTSDVKTRQGRSKLDPVDTFWRQTDFGYVKERRDNMVTYCNPQSEGNSSLQCTDLLQYCRGTDLYVDLRQAHIGNSTYGYRGDVLKAGDIGGHCTLDKSGLLAQTNGNMMALSTWYPEMQHFTSLPSRPIKSNGCDVIIDKPTIVIKPDSGGSMYHHFCDFVNLYVSQHVNNSFTTDVNILLWHTSFYKYVDLFKETWSVFTDHPLFTLNDYDGKRVCLKDVVFSFLARQGLYYALRPIENCYNSGMMRAFSQHTLHRLGVTQEGPLSDKLRVTFISRSTKYRNIVNEKQILSTLKSNRHLQITMIDFNRNLPFVEQLKISQNTDILMGIHGAGLTHMLFLPDWAAVFEVHNCGDPQCYLNLARLRGVKYFTWEDPEKVETIKVDDKDAGRAWEKFVNYKMDDMEILRLVQQAALHVTSHPAFLRARAEKYENQYKTKGEL